LRTISHRHQHCYVRRCAHQSLSGMKLRNNSSAADFGDGMTGSAHAQYRHEIGGVSYE
jgi:hypothetical protein